MSHGRLLAIIDARPAPVPALGLLLDVAIPLAANSIDCVFLDSQTGDEVRRMALLSAGNAGTPPGWCRPIWNSARSSPQGVVRASNPLEQQRRLAVDRGLHFRAERWGRFSLERALDLTRNADLVLYEGAARDGRSCRAAGLLKTLLGRAACPVAVCRVPFSGIHRAVVVTRADGKLDELLRWGQSWSARLNVPLAVVLYAGTARQLSCRMRVVEQAADRLNLSARLSGYRCTPAEIASRLDRTDLCLIGAAGRSWPVELCLGDRTEDLLRLAPCPVAALPRDPSANWRTDSGERTKNRR